METHQEPKYTCDYCDKKFRKKEAYNQHINEHNGIFEYKCEPCNKVSYFITQLSSILFYFFSETSAFTSSNTGSQTLIGHKRK